jgi:uncharacterized repeat protein (TIGR03803 family)
VTPDLQQQGESLACGLVGDGLRNSENWRIRIPHGALVTGFVGKVYGSVSRVPCGCTTGPATTNLGKGTVSGLAVNVDGTGFRTLHNFTGPSAGGRDLATNDDGAVPLSGLTLSGSTLYGAASLGGTFGWGTIFAVNTNGSGFRTLHSFSLDIDGGRPNCVAQSGNRLYGMASGEFGASTLQCEVLPIV